MLLPLQGVNAMAIRNPGCRFACPGLCAVALSGRAGVHYWMQNHAEKNRILNTLPNGVTYCCMSFIDDKTDIFMQNI